MALFHSLGFLGGKVLWKSCLHLSVINAAKMKSNTYQKQLIAAQFFRNFEYIV